MAIDFRRVTMARVLITEDDLDLAKAMIVVLSAAGHQVDLAADPVAFASCVNKKLPNLLILDMQTPGGGAPHLKTIFENMPAIAQLPAIFCTGMPVDMVQRWFPASPRRRYLRKPADLEVLKALVAELLAVR